MPGPDDALPRQPGTRALAGDPPSSDEVASRLADVVLDDELRAPPRTPNQLLRVIDYAAEAFSAALLVAITVTLFLNASARYLLNASVGWASELATSLVVWLTVLGTFVAARRGELIVVNVVAKKLSPRLRNWATIGMALLGSLGLAYLAWHGIAYVQEFGSDHTAALHIPKAWVQYAIPVGAVSLIVALLTGLRKDIRTQMHEFDGGDSSGARPDS